MSEAAKTEKVKSCQVVIIFDRKEGSPFGGVNAQSVTLLIDEDTKNKVIKQFTEQEGVLTVHLSNGVIRHINARNILYIDETEIVDEGGDGDK